MLRHFEMIRLLVLVAACSALAAESARAQTAPAQRQPAAPKASQSSDAAAKQKILSSPRWRQVRQEFQKWLSVQVVYTPQQIKQLERQLDAEVRSMSAAELEQFLNQWDAKLKTLLGPDANEAREWLGQYMSNMAAGYRKQFLKSLGPGDITNMTAAQVEQRANQIRAERMSIQQQQAATSTIRQQNVEGALQTSAAQQQALQAQASSAAQYRSYQSPYSPTTTAQQMFSEYNPEGPQMSYYMDATTGQFYYSIP